MEITSCINLVIVCIVQRVSDLRARMCRMCFKAFSLFFYHDNSKLVFYTMSMMIQDQKTFLKLFKIKMTHF